MLAPLVARTIVKRRCGLAYISSVYQHKATHLYTTTEVRRETSWYLFPSHPHPQLAFHWRSTRSRVLPWVLPLWVLQESHVLGPLITVTVSYFFRPPCLDFSLTHVPYQHSIYLQGQCMLLLRPLSLTQVGI